jgi:hypothetical protein
VWRHDHSFVCHPTSRVNSLAHRESPQPLLGVVVIFRVTQLILVVDFELLRGFGFVIYLAYGRLIFPLVFVVTVIVIVFGASCWRWRVAFGLNIAH